MEVCFAARLVQVSSLALAARSLSSLSKRSGVNPSGAPVAFEVFLGAIMQWESEKVIENKIYK